MITTLTATLPTTPHRNGKNLDCDKERIGTLTLVGINEGRPVELAQARFWMARSGDGSRPVYCSVWVYDADVQTAGHGRARGYGYHKRSAAQAEALSDAGIGMAEAIDGHGNRAMEDALIAVGVALGHDADTLAVLS